MRRFRVSDTRKETLAERSESLAGVITLVEMSDDEVDELADLEVGDSMTLDGILIKRTE